VRVGKPLISPVRAPPAGRNERVLELYPALVGFVRRFERLSTLRTLRFGYHDLIPGRVVAADLALQELGAALKEVKHS
jgi:hypothetical protein